MFPEVFILGLIIHADELDSQLDGNLWIEVRAFDGVVWVASYDVIFQCLQIGVRIPVLHDGFITSVEQIVFSGEIYIDEFVKNGPAYHTPPAGQNNFSQETLWG